MTEEKIADGINWYVFSFITPPPPTLPSLVMNLPTAPHLISLPRYILNVSIEVKGSRAGGQNFWHMVVIMVVEYNLRLNRVAIHT